MDVYYRLAGKENWRRQAVRVELKKLSRLWILLGVLIAIVGLVWFFGANN